MNARYPIMDKNERHFRRIIALLLNENSTGKYYRCILSGDS